MKLGLINTWKDYRFTSWLDICFTTTKRNLLFNIVIFGFGFKIEK